MSAIFGILNFDGKPVAHEHLMAMSAGLACPGSRKAFLWRAGNVGLGHVGRYDMPEVRCECLPRQHPARNIVVIARGRIDNRDELFGELKAGADSSSLFALQPSIPNGDLVLRSYLRWGERCVQHIVGDWSFALWDARQRKLLLARDRCGISGMHYYVNRRFFAFSSSLKGLLALSAVPKQPNLLCVAQVVTSWPGDGVQTAYEGILRLPPAHALTATTEKVKLWRYWFLENIQPVHLRSDEEYLEAFLDLYTKAVKCRLCSPLCQDGEAGSLLRVGATLSSGLDSSSVCSLAARELSTRGQRLTGFTAVPIYDTKGLTMPHRYGDEAPLVEVNRQFIKNLDVQYIQAENFSPLAGIRHALDIHDSPMHATGNAFWIHALLQAVREQGFDILLTGQVGNGTVSWSGGVENFWPLFLTGRWPTLWRKANRSQPSLLRAFKYHFLRPIIRPIRCRLIHLRLLGREPWISYSSINPQFARQLNLTRRMKASGHDPIFPPSANPRQARLRVLQPGADITGSIWAENGAAYGLEVRDPTMDERLAEFCFAIPDEQYRLNGQDRALIRRAMQNLLPDAVRLNTSRGLQAADLGYRLLEELPQLQATLARLEQSELVREVLDLQKMRNVLQSLKKEVSYKTTEKCRTILTRGVMAGLFLLRF